MKISKKKIKKKKRVIIKCQIDWIKNMKITNFFINMLRISFVTIVSVVLVSCAKEQNMLYIGNTLSDDFFGKLESELSMTSSGSFSKLYKIKSDNKYLWLGFIGSVK